MPSLVIVEADVCDGDWDNDRVAEVFERLWFTEDGYSAGEADNDDAI